MTRSCASIERQAKRGLCALSKLRRDHAPATLTVCNDAAARKPQPEAIPNSAATSPQRPGGSAPVIRYDAIMRIVERQAKRGHYALSKLHRDHAPANHTVCNDAAAR